MTSRFFNNLQVILAAVPNESEVWRSPVILNYIWEEKKKSNFWTYSVFADMVHQGKSLCQVTDIWGSRSYTTAYHPQTDGSKCCWRCLAVHSKDQEGYSHLLEQQEVSTAVEHDELPEGEVSLELEGEQEDTPVDQDQRRTQFEDRHPVPAAVPTLSEPCFGVISDTPRVE